ncbi:MAG TPA: hypothetical protein VL990_00895 [Acidobacteriaceae bacterium]|nr:hypothetical protein [Acidobacteriaceae bacterium]
MTAAERSALAQSAQIIAANVQAGNAAAVRTETIASVAAQFDGIANSIEEVTTSIHSARLTVDDLYLLDATDLKAPQETQFFCGVQGSALTVEITIPDLPAGKYALAVVHATGVPQPQQLSLILQNDPAGSSGWKLAGFFTRPMVMGGHDGLWFWRQARDYAAKKQVWDAWFYYQTAQYLLEPVDFISSPNLQKLQKEADQNRPDNLPGADPMRLNAGPETFDVTNLHTGELSSQLDLVVTYNATPNQDPVAARAQVTSVMRALLQQHPELQSAFHGLWVYAQTPGNRSPFALELPMDQIESSTSPSGQRS